MINFGGLKTALKKFDKDGRDVKSGNWQMSKGRYDCWWSLYYKDSPVLQCIAGRITRGSTELPGFTKETEKKLIRIVKSVYSGLSTDESIR